jgi:hypothetical protein
MNLKRSTADPSAHTHQHAPKVIAQSAPVVCDASAEHFHRSLTLIVIVRSSVRAALVTIRFVSKYFVPAVPPDSQIVVAVVVCVSLFFVMPVGSVQVLVAIVSPPVSHADQSI